jgi:pimeloyl-ACP methyl ester carboxylesterase
MTSTTALELREPDEAGELVRLSFGELAGFINGIRDFHYGVAGRAFRWTGPGAVPVRAVHDRVADTIYGGLSGATRGLGNAAASAVTRRPGWSGRVVSTTPAGSALVGVLDGLIGDQLERRRSALHEPMSVRVGGRPVVIERGALGAAFPAATPRLVVFVHGLMETEHAWRMSSRESGETYGSHLERDLAATPVYVRFNTGRHISHNGLALAELLEQLIGEWPVDVDQIALVGHSMGGLVSRSACYQAAESGMDWVRRVRHVVSLGTPHMGAPLAQVVHYASAAFDLVPETRPFSHFLRRRSAGIRDLRQGSLVDEDWSGAQPDALRAAACKEIPLLEGATHCFVSACITRSPRHPLGRLVGDYLVLVPSASGRSRKRRIPFKDEHGMHLGRAHHFALLNHPDVYPKLRSWLATPPPGAISRRAA